MARALVFGGTGQLGFALSKALAEAGWAVEAAARGGRPLDPVLLEAGVKRRNGDERTRQEVIAEGAASYDAVFDPNCYSAADAADLLEQRDRVGAFCVVSSASVYQDAEGRSLETARDLGFPDFRGLIGESNAIVEPGDRTYSERKAAMEQAMQASGAQVSILRPGAIYGVKARHPREWWFVKRALDQRQYLPVCLEARSVFQTSSAVGLASLARICFEEGHSGTFNVADPTAPTVAEIATAIGRAIGCRFDLSPFPGPAQPPAFVGRTPWSARHPIALDTAKARSLGWDGGPSYAEAVTPYCNWLIDTARRGDWRDHFTGFRGYAFDPFNYAAEDAAQARRSPPAGP